jgi:hypothetical protein
MSWYTKGPWRVGYGERHDQDECDIGICGDIFILAKIEGPNYSHCEANARLIAAAPDMYEVLTSVLADIEGGMVTQGTINEIKYALAQANGMTDRTPMQRALDADLGKDTQ